MASKYEKIKDLEDGKFFRLTGIKKDLFWKIVMILREAEREKKRRGGRKNKLIIEDMLLITLEYLREYRTYFHIGQSYGISESSAYKTIIWVENTLIKHPDFALPGKKSLYKTDAHEVILVDATETPIQRPKKSKNAIIQAKKDDIP
jgi:hypothetical protein